MTEGAVLYRDLFDVKQPGIFLFYAAGGLLFGFTEIGIHLFELVYWLAFSAFALVALRPYLATSWAPSLVPLFTVAVYYAGAGLLDIGQVEILVAFPLLLAWWLIDQADPRTASGIRRYAAAGLAAAAVVLLKHLYLLIVFAFLAYAGWRARRGGIAMRNLGRALVTFAVSLAVPLALVAAYYIAHGQLGRIWWAYFEMAPAAQLMKSGEEFGYLKLGFRRFLITHGPVLILGAMACIHVLFGSRGRRRDLGMAMLLWLMLGAFAFIVLQGWPEYKWALFTVPLGILAVLGVEAMLERARACGWSFTRLQLAAAAALGLVSFAAASAAQQTRTRLLVAVIIGAGAAVTAGRRAAPARASRLALHVLTAALAVSIGVAAVAPVEKLRLLREHDFARTAAARTRLRYAVNPFYRAADQDLVVLQQRAMRPGALYVFGDPILLYRANRPQAVPILGWGPEFLDDRAWRQLDSDLRATLPPYIVVDGYIERYIRRRCPSILDLIASQYEPLLSGASGTWYVVRDGIAPSQSARLTSCGIHSFD
jgi:hypothetical protein